MMRVGRVLTACELASLFGLRHRVTSDASVNFEGLTENKAKESWFSWLFNCQTESTCEVNLKLLFRTYQQPN